MPPFFVCQATGQDQREVSALYEYFNASTALRQPAAIALGGWEPIAYGRTGMGPAAPSLSPLLERGWGWTPGLVTAFVDDVCRTDSASPNELQLGGGMRRAPPWRASSCTTRHA
jgi:hypothetical protein